jgi:hypothetical protein
LSVLISLLLWFLNYAKKSKSETWFNVSEIVQLYIVFT